LLVDRLNSINRNTALPIARCCSAKKMRDWHHNSRPRETAIATSQLIRPGLGADDRLVGGNPSPGGTQFTARPASDEHALMAKSAKPDAAMTAKSLTAREKVALFCAASDIDHAAVGILASVMQSMEIRSLAWQGDPRAFVISMNLRRRHLEARKAGKLAKGGRPLKTGSRADPVNAETLEDQGIDKHLADPARKAAAMSRGRC
jgi:hypothetical protein